MGYDKFYNKNVTIIDAYPGLGVWSAALHNVIRPQNHILLEPHVNYKNFLKSLERPDNSWRVHPEDPFRWSTFQNLVDQKLYEPRKLPRTDIHNEIIFTANLSMIQGEQLCVQYLNCVTNQSWLQQYGRVRMLLWVREPTAEKLLATKEAKARHRVSVQCESCTESRVLLGEITDQEVSHSALLETVKGDFHPPKSDPPVLLEINPIENQVDYVDSFEYVIKMLFVLRTKLLREALGTLGPGAQVDLADQLQDILDKRPQDMSLDEIKRVVYAFEMWAFKPDILHDFYDDGNGGLGT
ncbi:Mtf1p [Sugiyamaella lignohabitans]|uniref:rRNA adenine N(6)-methyltransferase n=1 Tax=Sugiyamaella lignohabitans TaxID=796027 RepID=A0A167F9F3_9ASCO|nr:Mtf1p [Sugiyamaella lignohabitans]ANB14992.1 Mtf1p [Sugiyamaella lignohabitans]